MPSEPARTTYIYYFRGLESGGPEALHQLGSELQALGVEVFLVPTPETRHELEVARYAAYGCCYADVAEDRDNAVVIVPEAAIDLLVRFRRARHVIWWLSVDYSQLYYWESLKARGESRPVERAKWLVKIAIPRQRGLTRRRLQRLVRGADNYAQSVFAQRDVAEREGVQVRMLSDYLTVSRDESVSAGPADPLTIAYNPSKGMELTAAVVRRMPDVEWRPLKGLTRSQMDELLSRTHVYLDLGYHPGKDRIPREAAVCGCVVLVARFGSARFAEDVPIDEWYKVAPAETEEMAAEVCGKLREIASDLERHLRQQADYAARIGAERRTFEAEVKALAETSLSGRWDPPVH